MIAFAIARLVLLSTHYSTRSWGIWSQIRDLALLASQENRLVITDWWLPKGRLISKLIYEVIVSPKIRTKNCQDFCPHRTGPEMVVKCAIVIFHLRVLELTGTNTKLTVQRWYWTLNRDLYKWRSSVTYTNGILLPKLFWATVRKNCSSDREKLLKFEAEGLEFANFLRLLDQFIQTVKGQNNFCNRMLF